MKRGLILSAITASLIFGSLSLQASQSVNHVQAKEATAKQMKSFVKNEVNFESKKYKTASKEIANGLNDTLKAIGLIEKGKIKEAKVALKNANKSFDKALKTDPSLGLVPIDSDIMVYRYGGGTKSIKSAVSIAKDAIKHNDLQVVRDMIDPLKDEIDITTHYLPMDMYPQATKIATKLLDKGKTKEAYQELLLGLSTIVGDQVVIPIPLLAAQDLVNGASKVDKKDKKKVLALLDDAKAELQKAKLLGYAIGYEKEYKSLNKKIDALEKEVKGKNIVEKLYRDLKEKIKALVGKNRANKKDINSKSFQQRVRMEHKSAVKEENKDITNFVTDQRLNAY